MGDERERSQSVGWLGEGDGRSAGLLSRKERLSRRGSDAFRERARAGEIDRGAVRTKREGEKAGVEESSREETALR